MGDSAQGIHAWNFKASGEMPLDAIGLQNPQRLAVDDSSDLD
jgi:hypothetical protein